MNSKFSIISPLYEYWQSDQDDQDEMKRISFCNNDSPASVLFLKEPYKWENLFQCILRQISNGDEDSFKGLFLLLNTLNTAEKARVINRISEQQIFSDQFFSILNNSKLLNTKKDTKTNIFRFLKILYTIFTNPYGLKVKRKKQHIYEHTGDFFNRIRISDS